MHDDRFDRWLLLLARPRRAVLGGVAGLLLASVGGRRDALACRANGKPCDRANARECCSGTCRKVGSRFRCRPRKIAAGCTNRRQNNSCLDDGNGPNTFACPNNPAGVCFVDDRGRPICAGSGECVDCRDDADCRDLTGFAAARCIRECRNCNADTNGRACLIPVGSESGTGS